MWLFLSALASEPPTCPPAEELVPAERWLRAASLDIRGVIPSPEETLQVTSPDELPAALLDAWLASDAFVDRAVRHHRSRLWNRFDDAILINTRSRLAVRNGTYGIRTRNVIYRGNANVDCGDFEATDADGDGRWDTNAQGQEGWVRVHPYWIEDPDVTVQVCAFEANPNEVSPAGTQCWTDAGLRDPDCGCGPDLLYCASNEARVTYRAALGEAMDVRIAEVLRSGRPYTDLYTEDVVYVNGPLVHFYRYLSNVPAGVKFDLPLFDYDNLPDLDYHDTETWVAVPTHEAHAGIFTDPAFLVRFMTNRARVNRFYEDFLCQPLTAPSTGIDLDAPVTLDLANRSGCNYCHAIIEPAGVYWGRFPEGGAGFLDPETYPAFDQTCAACSADGGACPEYCERAYTIDTTDPELDPFVGEMRALEFRPESEHAWLDQGPGALVETHIASGRIPQCLTEKTADWLLGTEVDAGTLDTYEAELLASSWDYRSLVRAIVTSETYRRAR